MFPVKHLKCIQKELVSEDIRVNDCSDESLYECCPLCGYNYSHLIDVERDASNVRGNQGNVVLHFSGECGHQWMWIFEGHKGQVSRDCFLLVP